jgi:Asp/Glu/hydantoin racemase
MAEKLGFVHTGVPIGALFKGMMEERLPEVPSFHIVDDSLIKDCLAAGGLTPSILKRLCGQVTLAREAGADLIMVTCSSIGPGVDVARQLVDVDVMRVDDPMAEKAVAMADTVGVLATAKTTMAPTIDLIKNKAEVMGKSTVVESTLCSEAFDHFLRGDMEGHDRLVMDAAEALAKKADVVVLAQASMSHLAEQIENASGVPVLTSPKLAMDALESRLKG